MFYLQIKNVFSYLNLIHVWIHCGEHRTHSEIHTTVRPQYRQPRRHDSWKHAYFLELRQIITLQAWTSTITTPPTTVRPPVRPVKTKNQRETRTQNSKTNHPTQEITVKRERERPQWRTRTIAERFVCGAAKTQKGRSGDSIAVCINIGWKMNGENDEETWLTNWEKQCTNAIQEQPDYEQQLMAECDSSHTRIWNSFQDSATAVAQLYRGKFGQ